MHEVLLSVAPVSGAPHRIDPAAIAEDVCACHEAGAAMVHLHVRDENGTLTPDIRLLEETVRLIRSKCDIVVEISTGGVSDLSIEERCVPCHPGWVEANSLNVGSVNLGDAVYRNPTAKGEENKVKGILGGIFDHYVAHPDRLPGDYAEIAHVDGLRRAVCDYVAGMTDGYAMEVYGDIFIPAAWSVK